MFSIRMLGVLGQSVNYFTEMSSTVITMLSVLVRLGCCLESVTQSYLMPIIQSIALTGIMMVWVLKWVAEQ